jgi:O-antigen/teichoic acid export membrane protein
MRRQLFRETVIYGGTALVRHAIGLVILEIYTRVLDQSSFGSMDLLLAAAGLISLLLDLQLGPGITRFYHTQKEQGLDKEFLGGALTFRGWVSFLPAMVIAGVAFFYGAGYSPAGDGRYTLWIIVVSGVPFALMVELMFLQLRLLERTWTYSLLSVGSAFFGGAASIYLVVYLKWGIAGVFLGQLFSNAAVFIALLASLRNEIRFRWVPPSLGQLMRYGLPLVPGLLLSWCWVYLIRFLLAMRLPLTDIATFALGMKVLLFMGFIASAYRMAWEPLSMKILSERGQDAKAWYASSFEIQSAGLLLITALLAAGSRPLIALLAPSSYAGAAKLVPFLAVSSLQTFAASSLNIGNQVAYKTWYSSFATFVGILVMTAILWVGLEYGGLLAAAVGMVAGSTASASLVYWTSQRHYRVPYRWASLLSFSIGMAGILLIHGVDIAGWIPGIASCPLILVAGGTAAWFVLGRSDKELIRNIRMAWSKA